MSEGNKIDGIIFERKFTQVPNRILTCRRLSRYGLLLAILINLKNMRELRKPPEPNPNDLTVSKRQLRFALGFCGVSAIEKQLKGLRILGIVTSFSKQDGEDGYFSVTLADNLEKNPYVVLDVTEKQVIKECKIPLGKGRRDNLGELYNVVEKAADSVEASFIEKMSQEVGEIDECKPVKEYKEYLKSCIVKSGLGTFEEVSKRVTPTSMKTKAVQEAKQERRGMSLEDFDRMIGGAK